MIHVMKDVVRITDYSFKMIKNVRPPFFVSASPYKYFWTGYLSILVAFVLLAKTATNLSQFLA